jgi:hypothetical protein
MRSSSSLFAPSAVAIFSTALLCGLSGTAVSQTATGGATPLPSITVDAPKQAARPQRPQQTARSPQRPTQVTNTVASRATSPTAQTPPPAKGSTMAKLAALERAASSCNGGCETSFKTGNAPWVGCSETAGYNSVFSATCRDTLTYKDYADCKDTKMFLGWDRNRAWWYCTSMLAGGKFKVAEVKRSGRSR